MNSLSVSEFARRCEISDRVRAGRLSRIDGAVTIWPSLACRKPEEAIQAPPMFFTSTAARPNCGRFQAERRPRYHCLLNGALIGC